MRESFIAVVGLALIVVVSSVIEKTDLCENVACNRMSVCKKGKCVPFYLMSHCENDGDCFQLEKCQNGQCLAAAVPEITQPFVDPVPEITEPFTAPVPEITQPFVDPTPEITEHFVAPAPEMIKPAVLPAPEMIKPAVLPAPEIIQPIKKTNLQGSITSQPQTRKTKQVPKIAICPPRRPKIQIIQAQPEPIALQPMVLNSCQGVKCPESWQTCESGQCVDPCIFMRCAGCKQGKCGAL